MRRTSSLRWSTRDSWQDSTTKAKRWQLSPSYLKFLPDRPCVCIVYGARSREKFESEQANADSGALTDWSSMFLCLCVRWSDDNGEEGAWIMLKVFNRYCQGYSWGMYGSHWVGANLNLALWRGKWWTWHLKFERRLQNWPTRRRRQRLFTCTPRV